MSLNREISANLLRRWDGMVMCNGQACQNAWVQSSAHNGITLDKLLKSLLVSVFLSVKIGMRMVPTLQSRDNSGRQWRA